MIWKQWHIPLSVLSTHLSVVAYLSLRALAGSNLWRCSDCDLTVRVIHSCAAEACVGNKCWPCDPFASKHSKPLARPKLHCSQRQTQILVGYTHVCIWDKLWPCDPFASQNSQPLARPSCTAPQIFVGYVLCAHAYMRQVMAMWSICQQTIKTTGQTQLQCSQTQIKTFFCISPQTIFLKWPTHNH